MAAVSLSALESSVPYACSTSEDHEKLRHADGKVSLPGDDSILLAYWAQPVMDLSSPAGMPKFGKP